MYNDHLLSQLADTYQAEKVAGAKRAKLLKQARSGRPNLRHRLLAWGGNQLIIIGRALEERYEPAALPAGPAIQKAQVAQQVGLEDPRRL